MAAQTRPPDCWIVVDDGSVDGTLQKLRTLERDISFLQVLARARPVGEQPVKDRLATGSCMQAFNWALAQAPAGPFAYIGKLDGDIELPPDYFERLVGRLERDPGLGIAGGSLLERRGSEWKLITVPSHNVPGSVKLYRRECLADIGPLSGSLGWDTTDEAYARMRGYRTRSFRDIVVRHHRAGATRDGVLRGRARYGACAYINHFSIPWVTLRSLKVAIQRPIVLSGLAFLFGYCRAAVRSTPRVPDDEFRAFVRHELHERIRGSVRSRLAHPPARIRADGVVPGELG
jgi:biofilm PGA synthesis N-glycosyltransferase PgaC